MPSGQRFIRYIRDEWPEDPVSILESEANGRLQDEAEHKIALSDESRLVGDVRGDTIQWLSRQIRDFYWRSRFAYLLRERANLANLPDPVSVVHATKSEDAGAAARVSRKVGEH